MSEKFRLDRRIGFRNTFYIKRINVIIVCIGPSIILRSIYVFNRIRQLFMKAYWLYTGIGYIRWPCCRPHGI